MIVVLICCVPSRLPLTFESCITILMFVHLGHTYVRACMNSGALAPFNEEMTFNFRGPMNLFNIAVYQPDASGATWNQVSTWTAGKAPNNLVFYLEWRDHPECHTPRFPRVLACHLDSLFPKLENEAFPIIYQGNRALNLEENALVRDLQHTL